MTSKFQFDDLTLIEVDVSIKGKLYKLREPSEGAACQWRNFLLRSTKLGPDGKPTSIEGMADSQPYLVSLCLFEESAPGQFTKLVPLVTIRSWPSRIVKPLFEEAKHIGELGEDDTAESLQERIKADQEKLAALQNGHSKESQVKNESGATMDTSV